MVTRQNRKFLTAFAATIRDENPAALRQRGSLFVEPGNVLLSLEIQPTIIGAEVFHCPVRNGKEWYHHAMVTRQRLEFFACLVKKRSRGYVHHDHFNVL